MGERFSCSYNIVIDGLNNVFQILHGWPITSPPALLI